MGRWTGATAAMTRSHMCSAWTIRGELIFPLSLVSRELLDSSSAQGKTGTMFD